MVVTSGSIKMLPPPTRSWSWSEPPTPASVSAVRPWSDERSMLRASKPGVVARVNQEVEPRSDVKPSRLLRTPIPKGACPPPACDSYRSEASKVRLSRFKA